MAPPGRASADRQQMMSSSSRPGLAIWTGFTVVTLGSTGLALGPRATWGSPTVLFWVVSIGAGLCAVAAAAVAVVGFRRQVAEIALAGAALWAASILPFVHGLTAPGVLYGENTAVVLGAFLALPSAIVCGLPLVAPQWPVSRRLGRHWRMWSAVSITAASVMAVALLVAPRRFPAPTMGSPFALAMSGVCLVALIAMSWRHLTLYWVGRHPASLVTSTGFLLLGSSALVWWQTGSFTFGWWFIHAADIIGVLLGCAGALRTARRRTDVEQVLAPILSRDPLVALEFGLAPVVHRFVADLDAKDPITRDHVIRTAEAALRVGQEIGVPLARLRHLGLAALLHDVGKLEVPDAILHKPGRLDADEFAVMQRHTVAGDQMVAEVALLAPAARFIRGHHERIDGRGYPDGLAGEAIPLEARIISVCDAFDAMANTRQYREGMGAERAVAVLREHAGSQWDPRVVEAAIDTLVALVGTGPALDRVGREPGHDTDASCCVCADALPELSPAPV